MTPTPPAVPVIPEVFMRFVTLPRRALLLAGACSTMLSAGTLAQRPQPLPSPGVVDARHLSGYEWRSIGPDRGGRSQTIAGSSSRPYEYYFGAVGGGLWKTTDGGLTWHPVTDGKVRSSSVGAVAVAESNPDVVYIGMGETELRGNIMQGDGIYKSVDAGSTWTHCGLEDTQAIAKIRVDRTNPDLVYVAALGHPFGPNADRGIFRSTDGCKTWKKVLFRNDSTGAIDLAVDPVNPRIMFAALWEANRTSWSMKSGGPGSGLFKSTDGGDTWTEITRNPGLPSGVIGKIGVSVSPVDHNRVWAIVENENGGLFLSDDGGATWTRTSDDRSIRQRAFYYTHVVADTKDKDRVYVLNVNFFRSDDAGRTFKQVRPPHGDNHDLWIDPANSQRMAEANDGGGTVSINGGTTWTAQDFPTAQSYHVALTTDVPYQVCGAQQDNSTFCVQSGRGRDGMWAPMYDVGGGGSGYIAPDPRNPDVFYAGSQGALLSRFDRRTGAYRDVQVYPRFFSGEPSSALPERWQWTYPIVFSPVDPHILYTSSQHLWMTRNEGQTWTRISPDLTRADPKTLGESGGPITHDMNGPEIYATIFTIAPSHFDVNTIWTGSDDGLVQVTRDGGRTWKDVTPPGLPHFARISLIEASPHKPGTAYVAAKCYQLDDRAPYIYRTDDYGRTWTKIVTGIRADDYVHAVREDVKRAGLLYAGTEHGIYVSWDDGAHWQSLSLNLPDVQVPDIAVEDRDLVIATHGRSMYVLDDISALRQMTPQSVSSPLYVYQPRNVRRGLDQATFLYDLAAAADSLSIQVLDAKGAVIRTFSAGAPAQPGAEEDNPFRRGRAARPTAKAGLNRFTWDMRYPDATSFPGMILWGGSVSGPVAPPGRYTVRITAAGVTQSRDFEISRDPRNTQVTDADLQRQFALAMQIRDKVSAANDAVVRIRRIRKDVTDRSASAKDGEVTAAATTLNGKFSALEEDLYQVRNRSGQDPLNFPIKLNNRLAALMSSVDRGDAPPTDASYKVFTELSADLDVQLRRLATLVSQDLASFNRLLKSHQMESITP